LFDWIGPPMVPPNWCWSSGSTSREKELVEAAVELVAAGARHDRGGGPAGAAIFRWRTLGQDAELDDGVDRQLECVAAVHAVGVLGAVDQIHVLLGPHAVDGVGLALAERSAGCGDAGRQRRDAGLEQPELGEVAAVQRQVDDLASGDDAAEGVGRSIDQLARAADRDGFPHRGERQLRVDPQRLADVHLDRFLDQRGEAVGGDGEAVDADWEQDEAVETVGAGDGLAREAGVEVLGADLRPRDSGLARIGDGALDRAGRILGGGRRGSRQDRGCARGGEDEAGGADHRPDRCDTAGAVGACGCATVLAV
jgi:hypothetical protein